MGISADQDCRGRTYLHTQSAWAKNRIKNNRIKIALLDAVEVSLVKLTKRLLPPLQCGSSQPAFQYPSQQFPLAAQWLDLLSTITFETDL